MCRFTDSKLCGKRKASYFEGYEPLDKQGVEAPSVANTTEGLPKAGSLVSDEFCRLWSLDSNSADFLGLSQILLAPASPAHSPEGPNGQDDDRRKRRSGFSSRSSTSQEDCALVESPSCSQHSGSGQYAVQHASLNASSTAMLPPACPATHSEPLPATSPVFVPPTSSVPCTPSHLSCHHMPLHSSPSVQQLCPQTPLQPQCRLPQGVVPQPQPSPPTQPPAVHAVSLSCPHPAAFPTAAACVFAQQPAPSAPVCCASGAVANQTQADFELCEKFYASVLSLRTYASSVGLEWLHPSGCDTPSDVAACLQDHCRKVSKVCIDLFKSESPAVLSSLSKNLALWGEQQRLADQQHWTHVIGRLRLTEQQTGAILGARTRHSAQLSALYQERAEVTRAAAELASAGFTPGTGFEMFQHGFLFCAHVTQGLAHVTQTLQNLHNRERDLIMKLYLELTFFLLTPVQAATYVMEAFPHHVDVLAMINHLAC